MDTLICSSRKWQNEQELLLWQQRVRLVRQSLAASAIGRDRRGGTAKTERDLLRASGLLKLAVPTVYGGEGASWPDVLEAVRQFAQVDSSIAHLFAFQHLMVASVILYGSEQQQERFLRQTVDETIFWGNALNPLDRRTSLVREGDGYRLNGAKSFCSGASDSDRLLVSAHDQDGKLRILVVPTSETGISILDDWDAIGQRQTDSGGVTFENVLVGQDDILGPPGPFGDTYSGLRPLVAQTILATIYLGIAEGALAEALDFCKQSGRPWFASGVEKPSDDPYLQKRFGELWIALQGAEALAERAWARLQTAWEAGRILTTDQRGDAAVAIATFKATAARVGLDVTSQIFDLTGARGVSARHGLDRHWRNLRTHSLHDPVDYKLKEVGHWVLTQEWPAPSFYS